ncbi:MAG: hypothetical protein GY757_30380, partial [bacterium]|nr:hypothetical protein [bacterium]
MRFKNALLFLTVLLISLSLTAGQEKPNFDSYHSPTGINKVMKTLAKGNSKIARIHKLAVTPGKIPLLLLELGPETGKNKKTLPAVFIAANMEGSVPISSEAALFLAQSIIEKPDARKDKTWYILPQGNPDAAVRFFKKPLFVDPRNTRPYNDDMDDRVDEDGFEDLDGNGFITSMRVKDPEGQWMTVEGEPRLMKKADWAKGEKGS